MTSPRFVLGPLTTFRLLAINGADADDRFPETSRHHCGFSENNIVPNRGSYHGVAVQIDKC